MKTLTKVLAFATLTLPMAAAADPTGCDAGEEVLKFSLVTSVQGHPKGEAAAAFADVINTELDGRYCMEVYGNAELYDDNEDMFNALLEGDIHFAAPSLSKMNAYTDAFLLFDLPFLFDGPLHALEFFDSEAAQGMMSEIADDGFAGLGFWSNGMRQFSATVPMRLPGDAEGLTFRVQSSSPITAAMMDVMGIEGKKLAFSQVYDALKSREVQGQQNTWSNIQSKGFYLEQAAVTETNHTYLGYIVMTSQAFLDGLSEADRDTILLAMALTTHERNRFAFEINQRRRQDIIDDDGIVIRLSSAEMQEWRDAFSPIFEEFKPIIGTELVDAAIRINAAADPYN